MEQVLYSLPDGWEWKRIEDVFTITSGKNLTKKDMHVEGKFSVYGGNGIAGRYNDFNLSGSNIIIGRVGALCGNVRLVHGDIWVTDNAFFIKEYKVDILKEYLAKVLSTLNLGETANKAAQPVISYKGIKDLVIPYPPLDEQKRIVEKLNAMLTRIDTAIEHLQESVTLADMLYACELNEIFNPKSLPINQSGIYELPHGWEWKRIEDVFTITSGKNLTKKDMHVEGKFSVYGGNGIAGRYNDFNLSGSNIIIGRVGALCGNVRLVHGDIWVTDNAFFIKEYKVDILKEYLAKVLSTLNLGETANKAAQPVISYKGIKDLVIPYPPLDEQKRIVEKINNIGKLQIALKKQLQFKISSLGQLKASILDSAFKGKL